MTIISVLMDSRMACNNAVVYERDAVRLLALFPRRLGQEFISGTAKHPENAHKNRLTKNQKIRTYRDAVHYLLST